METEKHTEVIVRSNRLALARIPDHARSAMGQEKPNKTPFFPATRDSSQKIHFPKKSERANMPIHHFTPPVNQKLTMSKTDWAGWYQVSVVRDGKLVAECRWWNGREWNHRPNMRRGYQTTDLGDIRGIVHLVEQ